MSKMTYVEIPFVEKKVSRILYGSAIQPFLDGKEDMELLDAVYDMGVNAIDTARVYGKAEQVLGRWIEERKLRDKVVILSKCAHPDIFGKKRVNEKEIREDFAQSSQYLRTDYIDIYLLHRDDPDVDAGEIIEIMNAMHEEGKIGAFGGSNWTHQRIAEANEYAARHHLIPFTVSSPNFGLAEQVHDPWGGGCVSISGPSNVRAREWYRESGMPVIAYASLAHGLFSGKVKSSEPKKAGKILDEFAMKGYVCPENFERLRRCEELAAKKNCTVSQIAMSWIFKQDLDTLAVVGTSKALRMQENIDAMHIKLSEEEAAYLDLR